MTKQTFVWVAASKSSYFASPIPNAMNDATLKTRKKAAYYWNFGTFLVTFLLEVLHVTVKNSKGIVSNLIK